MYDMYMTDTIENLSLDRNSLSFILHNFPFPKLRLDS